jgi:hypothetical protein
MNISPSNPCNWDSEVNLTKVNKDSNLKDRVGIQMFQLIFEVRQQDVEEVAAADPEAWGTNESAEENESLLKGIALITIG